MQIVYGLVSTSQAQVERKFHWCCVHFYSISNNVAGIVYYRIQWGKSRGFNNFTHNCKKEKFDWLQWCQIHFVLMKNVINQIWMWFYLYFSKIAACVNWVLWHFYIWILYVAVITGKILQKYPLCLPNLPRDCHWIQLPLSLMIILLYCVSYLLSRETASAWPQCKSNCKTLAV